MRDVLTVQREYRERLERERREYACEGTECRTAVVVERPQFVNGAGYLCGPCRVRRESRVRNAWRLLRWDAARWESQSALTAWHGGYWAQVEPHAERARSVTPARVRSLITAENDARWAVGARFAETFPAGGTLADAVAFVGGGQ